MQEDKWNNLALEQWSQPEMILFPRGYLETSRDAADSHTGEEAVAGIWGRQVGGTGKYPTRHAVGGPQQAAWFNMSVMLSLGNIGLPLRQCDLQPQHGVSTL